MFDSFKTVENGITGKCSGKLKLNKSQEPVHYDYIITSFYLDTLTKFLKFHYLLDFLLLINYNSSVQKNSKDTITKDETMQDLNLEIKKIIIDSLDLEDITPEQISDSEALFGDGLGLDSIDALELGIALKKKFGVKFSAENEDNRKHFASVNALASYISQHTAE